MRGRDQLLGRIYAWGALCADCGAEPSPDSTPVYTSDERCLCTACGHVFAGPLYDHDFERMRSTANEVTA